MSEPGDKKKQTSADSTPRAGGDDSIKHTVRLVIVAFVLAFIFRAFVVEPFVIPTGSMAPTLLGAHTLQRDTSNGLRWEVDLWKHTPQSVEDPVTMTPVEQVQRRVRPGDRILVLKQIYPFLTPRRWSVIVFKDPQKPEENFIKRLIGEPGEEVWLVDGDVFTRPIDSDGMATKRWSIERKPRRVQRAVWSTIFSSELAPIAGGDDEESWRGPWVGEGWRRSGQTYTRDSPEPATLAWDTDSVREDGEPMWPIDDWVSYNADPVGGGPARIFPVSDVRIRGAVEPLEPGLSMAITLEARGNFFEASLDKEGAVTLRMRPDDEAHADDWTTLASAHTRPWRAGKIRSVEFWHVDQSLSLRVDGQEIAHATYDWSPQRRIESVMQVEIEGSRRLWDPLAYRSPRLWWSFAGASVTLRRVGLDRDLFYQPIPGLGSSPQRTAMLGPDEFFVLGDNSPTSLDSRRWDDVDPWVERLYDPPIGVVPRDLIMGHAFLVYFPAPFVDFSKAPIPDFGRVRLIR